VKRGAALLLAAMAAAAGCARARTEAVVSIDVYDITVGTDIDELQVQLSDDGPGAKAPNLFSADAPLCKPGDSGACYPLPLTLTVLPGPSQPDDVVRIDVQALLGGTEVLAEAQRFSFVDGAREDVKIVLYARCLNSDCASLGEECGSDGRCIDTPDMAMPVADAGAPPDLATTDQAEPDLSGVDLSGVDLAPPPLDLSLPVDLGSSCCPPCIPPAHCCFGACGCFTKCPLPP
jgi:hypothetical protein